MPLIFKQSTDQTNNPSLVVLGGIILPPDTIININGKKVLVLDKILDGVSVIERISRDPYEIELNCVFRSTNDPGNLNKDGTYYIFPQDALDEAWQKIWLPDSVQTIKNTYLNRLVGDQVVIESVTPATFRGSKNVALTIRAYENVKGGTLILDSSSAQPSSNSSLS